MPPLPNLQPENPLNLTTHKCTLGCPILDRLLDGGVPCNSITEIVSESGCGKTQICLQLLLCAQLPASSGGLSASSLYIHSETPFPLRRLRQLSLSFPSPTDPLDRILIHPVEISDDLISLLNRIEVLLSAPYSLPIKLIIIDSIAALFRSEFDNHPSDLRRRSSHFFAIAGKLKSLAKKFNLAVVVTNQVVDLVDSDGPSNRLQNENFNGCLHSSGRLVCPALGLSWANCINSRIFLSRCDEIGVGASGSVTGEQKCGVSYVVNAKRKMQVVFAPHLPESSCDFVIVREGVFGVNSS